MLWHCWLGDRKDIRPVKKLDVGLLVVIICLELCTTYSSSSPVVTTVSIIFASINTSWPRFTWKMAIKMERERDHYNVFPSNFCLPSLKVDDEAITVAVGICLWLSLRVTHQCRCDAQCVFNAISTFFIKWWDDFNLHSCVAQRVLRILFVALNPKSLCTTILSQTADRTQFAEWVSEWVGFNVPINTL